MCCSTQPQTSYFTASFSLTNEPYVCIYHQYQDSSSAQGLHHIQFNLLSYPPVITYSPVMMSWHEFPPTFQPAPQPAAPQNGWERLCAAKDEAARNAQPAYQPAAPQNGWERLRAAKDEAARNAQPKPLDPAPAAIPFSMPFAVPIANPVAAPKPEMPYYYYYAVICPPK